MKHEKKIAKLRECMLQIQDEEDKLRWDETMIALLEGVNETDERIMKSVLQQQWDYLLGCKKHDRWGEYNHNGPIPKIIVPTVRRIFDDFPIRNLVGVQPMTELVETVYSLEYRYEDVETGELITSDEMEALPPQDPFNNPRKLSIHVIDNKVEAGSRKLNGTWTPVEQEDIVHYCGIALECEKIQVLSQEIRADITNEVLHDLKKIGGEPEVVNPKGTEAEQILALGCRIRANCSSIAMKTRRGAGNFIVISLAMAKVLSKERSAKIELKDDYKSKHSEMLEVGTITDTIRVFVANVPDDEILIGYKGTNSGTQADAGYFYCPHTAMMTGGFTIHPVTFEPSMSFHTRYGKFTTENVEAYYRNIKVESDLIKKK